MLSRHECGGGEAAGCCAGDGGDGSGGCGGCGERDMAAEKRSIIEM